MIIRNNFITFVLLLVLFINTTIGITQTIPSLLTDFTGNNAGQTVFNFLTIPTSASELSGGHTCYPLDVTAIVRAPSATAFLTTYNAGFTHLEWFMGLRKEYSGACFALLDQGTIGFYTQAFTLGQFNNARDIYEQPTKPSALELALGVSYARNILFQKVSAGVTLSFIESKLSRNGARAGNCTVDITWKTRPSLVWWTYIKNIGSQVIYNQTKELQPLEIGTSFFYSSKKMFDTLLLSKWWFDINAGTHKQIDEPIVVTTSIALYPLPEILTRIGYEYRYGQPITTPLVSFGMGLSIRPYSLEAGWKMQSSIFGSVWALTLNYQSPDFMQKKPIEFLSAAQRHFENNRYYQCITYANKALQYDPNLYKAHSLIAQSQSAIRQLQGLEITMIYSGNILGNFLSKQENGQPVGGLARHIGAIKQLQKTFKNTIKVESGNVLPIDDSSTANSELPGFVHISSAKMHSLSQTFRNVVSYDVNALGEAEIKFARSFPDGLCTDCSKDICEHCINYKIITKGRISVAVITSIPKSFPVKIARDSSLEMRIVRLKQFLQSEACAKSTVKILISHDPLETITAYAHAMPELSGIIAPSLRQDFEVPFMIGRVPVLSLSEGGKQIGAFTMIFNEQKVLTSYTNVLIPLSDKFPIDSAFQKLCISQGLRMPHSFTDTSSQILRITNAEEAFAFISDRHGSPQIYVRQLSPLIEQPVSELKTSFTSMQPLLSKGKLIYCSTQDKDTTCTIRSFTDEKLFNLSFGGIIRQILSPDTQWVYAVVEQKNTRQTEIMRVPLHGGKPQSIISWPQSICSDIAFSPDARYMLFVNDSSGHNQIYLSDTIGLVPLLITQDSCTHKNPQFSLNGRYISYLSEKENFPHNFDLWIYDQYTGEKKRLTSQAHIQNYCWLPDNKTILYAAGINLFDFAQVSVVSGEITKFIPPPQPPTYSQSNPRLITHKKKTEILYVRTYIDDKRKLYRCSLDGAVDTLATFDNGNNWLP